MITQAVILAAGKGTRLRASDADLPKPLQRVGGVPLVKRVIGSLADAGVRRVVVVTGFMGDLVRDTLHRETRAMGVEIVVAHNSEFEKANGISVMVGGAAIQGPFLLSMADHLYTPAIARLVGTQDMAAADLYLATDPRIGDVLDIDDATKVKSDGTRILDIGKQITDYDRIDCGVFAVNPRLCEVLAEVRAARGDCSLSEGVKQLAIAGRARIADIGDSFWQDVDTPLDRDHAERALAMHEAALARRAGRTGT
jgi:choline kinase